jgi:Ca2+:H+ antiporter
VTAADTPKPSGGAAGGGLSRFLNVYTLLLFFPVALLARAAQWGDIIVFAAAGLAIVPLAALIGSATEALAAKLGHGLGGLINTTLGNAAELIITIFALRAGLVELVKASLVGSVLGNLLLVMGLSMLVGGVRHGTQKFERRTAAMNATLVILSFLVLAIPSAFDEALLGSADGAGRELFFSEGIAVIMIVLYALYLLYTLRRPKESPEEAIIEAAHEIHGPHISTGRALILLAVATVGIVIMSETLVGTVESVGKSLGLSEFFIGIIIVPLIGNVAEHLVAIQVAYKNRMDLSMGISLGSSLQVSLFVAPVLVFISLLFEKKLVLVFTSFELLALAVGSVVAALTSQDGESNWFEGVILLAVYSLLPAAAAAIGH